MNCPKCGAKLRSITTIDDTWRVYWCSNRRRCKYEHLEHIRPRRSQRQELPWEVRFISGQVDEIVGKGVFFHLEQMSDNEWWIGLRRKDKELNMYLKTKRAAISCVVADAGPRTGVIGTVRS